jgi:hypothetical protein
VPRLRLARWPERFDHDRSFIEARHRVSRVPLLLVESLDAAGAGAEDGSLRAAVLRRAGFAPQVLTLAPPDQASTHRASGARPAFPGEQIVARRDGRAAVRAVLSSQSFEHVIVAAASPTADEVARWLPAGLPARWWPVGLAAAASTRRLPWSAPRVLELIGGPAAGPGAQPGVASDVNHAALDWAIVDAGALSRRQHPLWDGDYLLAPAALAGETGEALLVAFAAVARAHVALDLIVLTDPQPAFERTARGLGVGTRVHFAGEATREAGWAWLKPASAMLVTGPGPIAAGLIMRALACGCPVLGAGSGGVGPALNAWLASRGAAHADGGSTSAALMQLFDRAGEVDRAIENGRRESAAHQVAPLATRLAAARPAQPASGAGVPGRQAA